MIDHFLFIPSANTEVSFGEERPDVPEKGNYFRVPGKGWCRGKGGAGIAQFQRPPFTLNSTRMVPLKFKPLNLAVS